MEATAIKEDMAVTDTVKLLVLQQHESGATVVTGGLIVARHWTLMLERPLYSATPRNVYSRNKQRRSCRLRRIPHKEELMEVQAAMERRVRATVGTMIAN